MLKAIELSDPRAKNFDPASPWIQLHSGIGNPSRRPSLESKRRALTNP
jgi:hypothetical protein